MYKIDTLLTRHDTTPYNSVFPPLWTNHSQSKVLPTIIMYIFRGALPRFCKGDAGIAEFTDSHDKSCVVCGNFCQLICNIDFFLSCASFRAVEHHRIMTEALF